MPVVAVVGRVHAAGLDRLRQRGFELIEVADGELEATHEAMREAVGLLVRTSPITAAMIEGASALRVVAKHGVGTDNIAIPALTARGIPCAITLMANRTAVAEHALFMMLELAKLGRMHDRAVRDGQWGVRNRFAAWELSGKTLLLVGCGRIGRELARRALAFDMRVLGYDPVIAEAQLRAAGVQPAPDLDAALAEADIVSLHLPVTATTHRLIDAAAMARMKPGGVIINTARGGLIDEPALADALRSGHLRGAGLDVFEEEPPAADHPLMGIDNVLLSPHAAAGTAEAARRMAVESADNILAALDGRLDPIVIINPEVLR
jgi:D-3-phosphoglycerate dehydrogenase